MTKLTAPQSALLARLPEMFVLVEFDARGNSIPTEVCDPSTGAAGVVYTTGTAQAMRGLMLAGAVVELDRATVRGASRKVWVKASALLQPQPPSLGAPWCAPTPRGAAPGKQARNSKDFTMNTPMKMKMNGRWYEVSSLEDASAKVQAFVVHNQIRSSEFGPVYVYEGQKLVANVSFNGRVWPPEEWTPEQQPLQEASTRKCPVPQPMGRKLQPFSREIAV